MHFVPSTYLQYNQFFSALFTIHLLTISVHFVPSTYVPFQCISYHPPTYHFSAFRTIQIRTISAHFVPSTYVPFQWISYHPTTYHFSAFRTIHLRTISVHFVPSNYVLLNNFFPRYGSISFLFYQFTLHAASIHFDCEGSTSGIKIKWKI